MGSLKFVLSLLMSSLMIAGIINVDSYKNYKYSLFLRDDSSCNRALDSASSSHH